MTDFKPIETQEQLDALIGERLKRERETMSKKYETYISPESYSAKETEWKNQVSDLSAQLTAANDKIANHDKELAERDKKIKAHESYSAKTRIANELGLSLDAANFLQGENEDEIRESAESLRALVGKVNVAPLASTEGGGINSSDAALMKMVQSLNK